jgi:hypothetical protein
MGSWSAKKPPSTHFSSQVDMIERSTFIGGLAEAQSKLAKPTLRGASMNDWRTSAIVTGRCWRFSKAVSDRLERRQSVWC